MNQLLRKRYLIAAFAGLLWAAAFPNMDVAGFAWIAPGMMLAAALGTRGGEAFRLGFVAGLVHYLVSLYWLLCIPYRWHGIPIGPAAGWLALGMFMALFSGAWVWLVTAVQSPNSKVHSREQVRGEKREGRTEGEHLSVEESSAGRPGLQQPVLTSAIAPRTSHLGIGVESESWLGRTVWTLSGAAAWVGLEMIIARIFSGFPWDLLGVSQHKMIPLIQISSVTGVYGVSFIVVWTSLSLFAAAMTILRRPTARSVWVPDIILPAMTVLLLFVTGFHRLNRPKPEVDETATRPTVLRVTFIQPSIPQTLIWDETAGDQRFAELLRLSEAAMTNKTDLLIWPEAAVPNLFGFKAMHGPILSFAQKHHVWMIVGADDAEPKPGSETLKDADFFNSSFLISPEGEAVATYRKRGLVIFGEYVPLVRWLPFMKYLTPVQGGFTPGKRPVSFYLSDLHVKTAVLICFEDVFPHLARQSVDEDTDFLVNITNNGWFDESAAQWQHGITAIFRAIENGVPLLRCSNNGLTCWVDQCGRIRQVFRDAKGTIYGEGVMTAGIPLSANERHERTFYNAHGDVFGCVCVAWMLVLLAKKIASRWQWRFGRH